MRPQHSVLSSSNPQFCEEGSPIAPFLQRLSAAVRLCLAPNRAAYVPAWRNSVMHVHLHLRLCATTATRTSRRASGQPWDVRAPVHSTQLLRRRYHSRKYSWRGATSGSSVHETASAQSAPRTRVDQVRRYRPFVSSFYGAENEYGQLCRLCCFTFR